MKKIIKICLVFSIVLLIGTKYVSASFFVFSSNKINTEVDSTFRVILNIDPSKSTIYTVKADISYPADILEIVAFNFADNWTPVNISNYSVIDNKNGKLIKTGGVPGGISDKDVFGSIIFRAKKKGKAIVSLKSPSFSLDSENKSTLNKNPQIEVIVKDKKKDDLSIFDIPSVIPGNFIFTEELKLGDKKLEVAYLQLCLRGSDVYLGGVTGKYDNITKESVRIFQEKYKEEILSPLDIKKGTGFFKKRTFDWMNKICFVPVEEKELGDIKQVEKIPDHLFDIHLELDKYLVEDSNDLVVRVILSNFGKEVTPIRLNFSIFDPRRKKVFDKREFLIVETEEIFTKTFPELDLGPGKYEIVLETLYNDDIRDEFRSVFVVVNEELKAGKVFRYLGWISMGLAGLVFVLFVVVELFRHNKKGRLKKIFVEVQKKRRLNRFKNKIKKVLKK